jgi:hypothetical protein
MARERFSLSPLHVQKLHANIVKNKKKTKGRNGGEEVSSHVTTAYGQFIGRPNQTLTNVGDRKFTMAPIALIPTAKQNGQSATM